MLTVCTKCLFLLVAGLLLCLSGDCWCVSKETPTTCTVLKWTPMCTCLWRNWRSRSYGVDKGWMRGRGWVGCGWQGWGMRRFMRNDEGIGSLKWKCHFNKIFITDYSRGCYLLRKTAVTLLVSLAVELMQSCTKLLITFGYIHWQKFHQYDNIFISVVVWDCKGMGWVCGHGCVWMYSSPNWDRR